MRQTIVLSRFLSNLRSLPLSGLKKVARRNKAVYSQKENSLTPPFQNRIAASLFGDLYITDFNNYPIPVVHNFLVIFNLGISRFLSQLG